MRNRHTIALDEATNTQWRSSKNESLQRLAQNNFTVSKLTKNSESSTVSKAQTISCDAELAANVGEIPLSRDILGGKIWIGDNTDDIRQVNDIEELRSDFNPLFAIYTQTVTYYIQNIICGSMPEAINLIPTDNDTKIILRKIENEIYFELIQESILLKTPPGFDNPISIQIGKPVHLHGYLDKTTSSLKFTHFEIDDFDETSLSDQRFADIFSGKPFEDDTLIQRSNSNALQGRARRAIPPATQLDNAIIDLNNTLNDASGTYDKTLQQVGKKILSEVTIARDQPESSHEKQTQKLRSLTNVIKKTDALVKAPFAGNNIADALDAANEVVKTPWGKRIGGLMMVLAGTAIIALSATVAITSFGVGTPFSVGGLVIGASLLTGGIATAVGVAGIGLAAGGMYGLFSPRKYEKISTGVDVLVKKTESIALHR